MTAFEPTFQEKGSRSKFRCPACGVLAIQRWHRQVPGHFDGVHNYGTEVTFARCDQCERLSIWINNALVFPRVIAAPEPNPDLQGDIQDDFQEARRILADSPRGAAALLRLCLQQICKQLGEPGANINADIASLVRKGLSETIQRALDIVRVTGNESVHPGQMDLRDDEETARQLFDLVNLIADTMISEPKRIKALYEKLPKEKRDAIEERDKKKPAVAN